MLDMVEMTDEQLREAAKRYEVDAPRTASRKELEDLIQTAIYKRQLALEEKAKAQRQKELEQLMGVDPQTKAKPHAESLAIANSPKVYAVFMNIEPGGDEADVTFNWGCTHTFHLWHGFLHVLPKCVIDVCNDPNDPRAKRPVYGKRKHPTIPDCEYDCVVGHRKRFMFEVFDKKPPKDASFGVTLNHKLYDEVGAVFPEPVTQS